MSHWVLLLQTQTHVCPHSSACDEPDSYTKWKKCNIIQALGIRAKMIDSQSVILALIQLRWAPWPLYTVLLLQWESWAYKSNENLFFFFFFICAYAWRTLWFGGHLYTIAKGQRRNIDGSFAVYRLWGRVSLIDLLLQISGLISWPWECNGGRQTQKAENTSSNFCFLNTHSQNTFVVLATLC